MIIWRARLNIRGGSDVEMRDLKTIRSAQNFHSTWTISKYIINMHELQINTKINQTNEI